MNLFAAAVLTKLFCARCVLTADEPKLGLDQDASVIGVTTSVSAEVNAVKEKPNMRRVKGRGHVLNWLQDEEERRC